MFQTVIITDLENLPINSALLQLVSSKNSPSTSSSSSSTSPSTSSSVQLPKDSEPISESVKNLNTNDLKCYNIAKKNIEELALYLKPFSCGSAASLLSRPMQRKLVTLVNCQLIEEEGRSRAIRAARSLGERTVTELILQHQNPQQLSANLWAAVRARGCQFLGPAMQEEVLKLVLLALEDGSALSRKVLVMFVVQRLEPHFPQASKTSIGHVVQLLYRASCFKVSKRESDSSLMQLKEEFRTYEALRREHDAQIVQIATEAGLRIAPDQWSALLYGDTGHKSHMQSIIDKLQTPQSFAQSVQELVIALQRTNDPSNLAGLRTYLKQLTNIDPTSENNTPSWNELAESLDAVKQVVAGLVDFVQQHGNRKLQDSSHNNHPTKYKISMCRDLAMRAVCPRGANCTFAHSEEELEKYRTRNRKLHARTPTSNSLNNKDAVDYLNEHSLSQNHLYVPSLSNKTSPLKEKPNQIPSQSNIQPQYDQMKPNKFQPINPCPITKTMPSQGINYNLLSANTAKPGQLSGQQNMNLLSPTMQPQIGFPNHSKTPTPGHQGGKYNSDMYGQVYAKTPSPHLLSPRNNNQKMKHFKYQGEPTSPRNMGQSQRHLNDAHHPNMGWNQHHNRQAMGPPHQSNIPKNYFSNPQQTSLPNSPNPYGGQQPPPSAMAILHNLELRKQEILKQLEKCNNFNAPNQPSNLFSNKMGNNNYVNNTSNTINNNQMHNNNGTKCGQQHLNQFHHQHLPSHRFTAPFAESSAPRTENRIDEMSAADEEPNITLCNKEDAMRNYWNHNMQPLSNQTASHQPQSTYDSNIERLTLSEVPTAAQNKEDFFVRSDSILTDDDYVPFDSQTQSKFGPISRMPVKSSLSHGLHTFDNQFPISNDALAFSSTAPTNLNSAKANNNSALLASNTNSDLMWYGNVPKTESVSLAGIYSTVTKEKKEHFIDAAISSADAAPSTSASNNSVVDNNKYQFRPTINGKGGENGKQLELNMYEMVPNEAEQNVLNMELKLIEQKLIDHQSNGSNLIKVMICALFFFFFVH